MGSDEVIVAPATGFFGGGGRRGNAGDGARVIATRRNPTASVSLTSAFGETAGRFHDRHAEQPRSGRHRRPEDLRPMRPRRRRQRSLLISRHDRQRACHGCTVHCTRGKAVFIGGLVGDVTVPYGDMLRANLQVRVRHMDWREDVLQLLWRLRQGI